VCDWLVGLTWLTDLLLFIMLSVLSLGARATGLEEFEYHSPSPRTRLLPVLSLSASGLPPTLLCGVLPIADVEVESALPGGPRPAICSARSEVSARELVVTTIVSLLDSLCKLSSIGIPEVGRGHSWLAGVPFDTPCVP
jgi:hypothetical protein